MMADSNARACSAPAPSPARTGWEDGLEVPDELAEELGAD